MKPLIVLLITFAITLFSVRLFRHTYDLALAGRIAMAVMLLFTAIGHFKFTEGMAMMIPSFVPLKQKLVYVTGIIEIGAAISLLIPGLRVFTGWLLIVFFLIILPANINAALQGVDYQNATFNGKGIGYLWFRIPLQILFILWVYFSSIRV